MQNGSERTADRLSGVGWIVLGGGVIALSLRMETRDHLGATFLTGPGFVPALLGGALCLLGLILILRASWGQVEGFLTRTATTSDRRALLALAMMLVFALGLVGRVPFGIAAGVFITVFIMVFNLPVGSPGAFARLTAKAAATGIVTATLVVLLFEKVFFVRLP